MTQINWQLTPDQVAGYVVTATNWNDVASDLRAFMDQTTSSASDNTPLPLGIDLVNDRVYISDPDTTTPEDGNHADTTLSVVGTTTLDGNTQQTGTFTVGVDDTGFDVQFFGAATGKSWLWDEDADKMIVTGTTTLAGDVLVTGDVTVEDATSPVVILKDTGAADPDSAPQGSFQVVANNGNTAMMVSIETGNMKFVNSDSGDADNFMWRAKNSSAVTNTVMTLNAAGDLVIDGDLSLGTTAAGETLNIAGVTTASGAGSNLKVKGGDATGTNQGGAYLALQPGMGTGSGNSGDILLQTGPAGGSGTTANTPTTVLTCMSNGNVYASNSLTVGKSSDDGKALEVYQASDAAIRVQNSTTGTGTGAGLLLEQGGTASYIWNYANGATIFGTNNAERMRITAAGLVGVGTTPSYLFQVGHPGTSAQGYFEGGWDDNVNSNSRLIFNDHNFGIGAGQWGSGSNEDDLVLWAYNQAGRGISFKGTSDGAATTFQSMDAWMRITEGKVGIGTTAPLTKLHIVAGDHAEEVARLTGGAWNDTVQGSVFLGFHHHLMTPKVYPSVRIGALETDLSDYDASLVFQTRNSGNDSVPLTRMTITDAGLVDIAGDINYPGGSSIYYDTSAAADSVALWIDAGNQDVSIFRVAAGTWTTDSDWGATLKYMGTRTGNNNSLSIFMDNQTGTQVEAMTILQDGKVGIGTTTPSALLSVTSTTGIARLDITGASSGYTRSDIVFYGGDSARGAGSYMFNAGADRNYFWGTLYGSDTNSDNFGVGRTENAALNVATADQGNACFMIRKGASTHGGTHTAHGGVGFAAASVYIDRNWGNYPGITVCNLTIAGGTTQGEFRVHGSNHSWASYPTASGADFACNFRIDGATYYTSDARRKTNIETITGALATINRMEGRSFNTINSDLAVEAPGTLGGKQYGFIAQEVESIVPNSVKYYPAEDTPLENGWCRAYSFDYGGFTAVLVEAVKELTARLEALEAA
jgi:hypothetical protein